MNATGNSTAQIASSLDTLGISAWLNPRRWLTVAGRVACGRWPMNRRRQWVRKTFRKWCLDEEIVVQAKPGFRIAASPQNYASYGIYFFGEYDATMTTALRHLIREGQTVWDVGTERGWFSCLMGQLVGPTGRVDSFEAFPENAARLRRNLMLNDMHWVHANEVAVSDTAGHALFHLPTPEVVQNYSYLENCSGVGYLTNVESESTIRVPTIALDQYAEDVGLQSLHLIKMDIEGAEVQALRGVKNVLAKFRPIVVVEYNRAALARAGTSWEELDALLDDAGYDRFTFRNQFRCFRLSDYQQLSDEEAVFNVYAFPREGNERRAASFVDGRRESTI